MKVYLRRGAQRGAVGASVGRSRLAYAVQLWAGDEDAWSRTNGTKPYDPNEAAPNSGGGDYGDGGTDDDRYAAAAEMYSPPSGRDVVAVHPGFPVTLSSDVLPEFREYERTLTACMNSYVRPKVSGYIGNLEQALRAKGVGCAVNILRSQRRRRPGGDHRVRLHHRRPPRLHRKGGPLQQHPDQPEG